MAARDASISGRAGAWRHAVAERDAPTPVLRDGSVYAAHAGHRAGAREQVIEGVTGRGAEQAEDPPGDGRGLGADHPAWERGQPTGHRWRTGTRRDYAQ